MTLKLPWSVRSSYEPRNGWDIIDATDQLVATDLESREVGLAIVGAVTAVHAGEDEQLRATLEAMRLLGKGERARVLG